MSVGEAHPFSGQLIDVGRRDLRFGIEATRIAIAHVIDEDEEYVGLRRVGSDVCRRQ
jgi:hypothetical protein